MTEKSLNDIASNAAERVLYDEMRVMKDRYATICIPPQPKKDIASLKDVMVKASPAVLEDFTRCCISTNNFVPIEKIVVGEWKNDFSYEQRFALWRGTGFKGLHAYGKDFIDEALDQDVPVSSNLWELHSQMNIKNFPLKEVYADSIEESRKNPQKVSLWNSKNPRAWLFKLTYFRSSPRFSSSANQEEVKLAQITPEALKKYLLAERDLQID